MKKTLGLLLIAGALGTGCAYGGVSLNAAGDRALIARNDSFLFGLLRKVVVCRADDNGVSDCREAETP